MNDAATARSGRAVRVAVAAATVVAIAVRTPFLADGLWYDEIAAFLGYSLEGPQHALTTYFSQANHVLHSALAAVFAQAFGVDELSIRLPSLCAGVLAVPGAAWLARECTWDRADPSALPAWTAGAMAVMPVAVLPATEARGYALMMLWSTLACAAWLRASRTHAGRWWAAYVAFAALGTWSHLVTACVPAWHGAWSAWRWWRGATAEVRATGRAGVVAAMAAAAASALLLAPVLGQVVALRNEFRALDGNEPSLLGPEGLAMLLSIGGSWWPLGAALALPLVIVGLARARQDRGLRLGLLASLGGAMVALLFPVALGSWLYARFLAFAVPGLALLLGAGAQSAWQRWRWAGAGLTALAAAGWIATLTTLGPRQQLREAVHVVAERMQPGERAVAVGLPDDVHAWYALAEGIDLPGAGPYGRDLHRAVGDRAVRWAVLLYPRAMPNAVQTLHDAGFRDEATLPGWIDWGGGEIRVLRRR